MCGICGIVDFREGRPIAPELVTRMRDAMVNRGPDDAGTTILPHAALGHRRLSIIDLSPRGRQPMSNEDGSVWLVFNGEIYDFEALRATLAAAGHRFSSDADSDVLVHGYEEWGIHGLLDRINGMFAFALWDAPRRTLHLARDRLGKKPLFYGWHDGRFLFASELKALWTVDRGGWRVRPDSVARFLYWTYLPGRETIYADAYQLLPGHVLTVTPEGQREERYWRLSFARKLRASEAELVADADRVVSAAVRRRLRSDVPLGAFLSGGVDSGLVVSCMAESAGRTVRTFSMGTADAAHDERGHARRVAEHCRTAHTEFEVTADAWGLLPRLVWEFGQPFGDEACIPTYYVAHAARRHVTVALTGDGGDESFAGYSQHLGRYLGAAVGRVAPQALLDRWRRSHTALLDAGDRGWRGSAARFLRYAQTDPLVNWAGATTWSLHHLPALWSAPHRGLADRDVLLGYALETAADFDGDSALDRALHHDLTVLLPFGYNPKVDVATMMSSLEARCPFQDREVVEWAATVPAREKLKPWEAKALLKKVAARRLPRDVVYRPKHGFSIPHDAWFRGAWSAPAHAIIFSEAARSRGLFDFDYLDRLWRAHASGAARHGTRFWLLLWLELWFRTFVDGTFGPEQAMPALAVG
ncbi:MAG: asparagine synthase (glutamine-hydrolyzing) [Deltaproteobacteria bacterium]|nr:asparagine synthase (glutamine-hydrolyzing) [Deltaproteobacteria bacterium]